MPFVPKEFGYLIHNIGRIMNREIDVSAVVTFHNEGLLAHTSLDSIERCRRDAEKSGLSVQLVMTLDCADDETRRVVKNHPILRGRDIVDEVAYRDLSTCRNHAISKAGGRFIGTFDGDDYFSANWITECVSLLQNGGDNCIFHPEMLVAFGAWNAYWWQIDSSDERYRPGALLTTNYWNACSFAAKTVFERCPYHVSRVGEAGFGYEDWHWNCETISSGFVHKVAPRTVRFERRREEGSLNVAHQRVKAVIRPSRFFEGLS